MNIVVAGAGLLGRLLAWRFAKLGWEVTLIDKDNYEGKTSCAYTAAGMLSPVAELVQGDSTLYQKGMMAIKQWRLWLEELSAPIYFRNNGSILVAHAQDKAEFQHQLSLIESTYQTLNISDKVLQKLSPKQLSALEPELNNFEYVAHLPVEGHLDNQAWFDAVGKELQTMTHVKWLAGTMVTKIEPYKVFMNEIVLNCDLAIDCRGLGAKASFKRLRGVRGECLHVYAPLVKLSHPIRLMHPRYQLYIVPRPQQVFILGATEIESEDNSPISVRSTLELLSAAVSVHHGFTDAIILKSLVNCRPTLDDHLPCIDQQPGFIAINGLYRHGYLLAPSLVSQVTHNIKNLISKKVDYEYIG